MGRVFPRVRSTVLAPDIDEAMPPPDPVLATGPSIYVPQTYITIHDDERECDTWRQYLHNSVTNETVLLPSDKDCVR